MTVLVCSLKKCVCVCVCVCVLNGQFQFDIKTDYYYFDVSGLI